MLSLLITLIIVCIVVAVLFYVLDLMGVPGRINQLLKLLVVVLALLWFVQRAGWIAL